jgi:hypothetical protein
MERRRLARAILRTAGLALMLAGAVHLIATPEIAHLLDGLSPKARGFALGPTLLDHVLVGILLLPLGFTTWIAADGHHLRETWARQVLIVNSLGAFALPLTLVIFMSRPEYDRAPLFLAGAALTALAALAIPIAALIGGA